MRRYYLWVPILLLLIGVAAAASVESFGRYDPAYRGTVRTDVAFNSIDPAADASYTTVAAVPFQGRQTCTLSLRASTAGASIKVGLLRGYLGLDGTFHARSLVEATVAASNSYTFLGKYACPAVAFDTAGYDAGWPILETISAGTVDVEASVH